MKNSLVLVYMFRFLHILAVSYCLVCKLAWQFRRNKNWKMLSNNCSYNVHDKCMQTSINTAILFIFCSFESIDLCTLRALNLSVAKQRYRVALMMEPVVSPQNVNTPAGSRVNCMCSKHNEESIIKR